MPVAETPTWPALITALIQGRDLTVDQAAWAMDEVMGGNASPVQLAGFLVALRAKGETVDELHGLADSMLGHGVPVDLPTDAIDIVGTGGDRAFTVNVSTMASLVIAGSGAKVVKHGNRASSSKSGSADVIEALGVNLALPVEAVVEVAHEVGIAFLFAQVFHPSMRHAAVARRELGVATVFNFLGPLTNPAKPRAAAIGCTDAVMAPLMAGVLAARGVGALVFRGQNDGLDEMAATGPVQVWDVQGGQVEASVIDPVAQLGLDPITVADLRGGDASHNAAVARSVLAGQPGPVRQTVELNAAAGLVALGARPELSDGPLVGRLSAGLALARESIDSGAAAGALARWVEATRRFAQSSHESTVV
ncbi:MAG: anthranilate phosphoribosyltransferase [Bifidobacteriaceae bacterium]|jgi:anthranilate phosphoribosyltransferase|nr:anthranilate phosphoribosyltransferase [Bifidobacteriaceae bacterium]